MHPGSSSWTVPPGFRFHPTEEELLSYYLRRKVACEPIVPDIIREVDTSKLQPWDLLDHCSVGMGPPDDYCYFFSHNHKGSRVAANNRGTTTAGYWRPVGRDKAIFVNTGERIGLRKTWVFYTSPSRRASSRGRKTDWTMHEYRLDDDDSNDIIQQVPQHDAWVVCKVFKKVTRRGFQRAAAADGLQSSHSLVGSTPPPVDLARNSAAQPITGFLDNLLSPFKTIKTVQFNLNLALFGPIGLHVDLGF